MTHPVTQYRPYIKVHIKDDSATLSGIVFREKQKRLAENVLMQLDGISTTENHLSVITPMHLAKKQNAKREYPLQDILLTVMHSQSTKPDDVRVIYHDTLKHARKLFESGDTRLLTVTLKREAKYEAS